MLRDREILGRDGFLVVTLHRDPDRGSLIDRPEIITRGFIYVQEAEDLIEGAQDVAERIAQDTSLNDKALKEKLQDSLAAYLYRETKRRPMIIPVLS